MQFEQLGLAPPLLRALARAGYTQPTPIQQQAIAPALAGRDLLGIAQTGTGKTAAFALPILQRLGVGAPPRSRRLVRALVLTPTRELAAQVGESFRAYGAELPLVTAELFGGVSERPQIEALRRGVDVIVATPGRLQDLMGQGHVRLSGIEHLVLDEADRMLDMGFLPDIRRIVAKVPSRRQTLLFSATLPPEIRDLAHGLLDRPVEVSVAPPATAASTVAHSVWLVERDRKQALLEELLDAREVTRALVFTRTKRRADRVAKALTRSGTRAEAIHGDKSQNARTRALQNFQSGATRVLVASDLASRGLDIDLVSHVFNFDLPNEPETYVHRIGRTGRAGASGLAISFCDREERAYLRDIERLLGQPVPIAGGDHSGPAPEEPAPARGAPRGRQQRGGRGRSPTHPRHDARRGARPEAAPPRGRGHPGQGRGEPPRRGEQPRQAGHGSRGAALPSFGGGREPERRQRRGDRGPRR